MKMKWYDYTLYVSTGILFIALGYFIREQILETRKLKQEAKAA